MPCFHLCDNLQLTEATLILESGQHAPLLAETELRPGQGPVLTLLLPMVVLTVLGLLPKLESVGRTNVQVCQETLYCI